MSEKVLLTGISGWIAKHTTIELLNSGYEVLGTVRNESLIEQTKDTISKYAPIDKLSFIKLDLVKDDGWNDAAKGCKYIFHIASPFPIKVSNNRESLLPPAVDGTLRVLNAGINAGVDQIVKTSSIVAMFRKPNRTNPYTFGEQDWTDENWVEGVNDYFLSKTKAERVAWELMESKGLKNKLTTICPGGVFGDALDKKGGTSIEYVRQFMAGKFPGAPKFAVLISDVKDIAKAHVACIGNDKVGGRRLIVGKEVKKLVELSQLIAEAMPAYAKKLPKKELPNLISGSLFFDSADMCVLTNSLMRKPLFCLAKGPWKAAISDIFSGPASGGVLESQFCDFGVILEAKLGPSWHQNRSKINQEINQQMDEILRSIFDPFCAQLGPKLGVKLGPSWLQVGVKSNANKMIKKITSKSHATLR